MDRSALISHQPRDEKRRFGYHLVEAFINVGATTKISPLKSLRPSPPATGTPMENTLKISALGAATLLFVAPLSEFAGKWRSERGTWLIFRLSKNQIHLAVGRTRATSSSYKLYRHTYRPLFEKHAARRFHCQ